MVSNREFMRRLLSFFVTLLLLSTAAVFPQSKEKATETPSAILPADFSGFHKGLPQKYSPSSAQEKLLKEYGLSSAEAATYQRGDRTITLKALRFPNATGAYGAFTYFRTPSM